MNLKYDVPIEQDHFESDYAGKTLLECSPFEMGCIAKFICEKQMSVPSKVIGAMVELLVNGYIQDASEEEIYQTMEFLISYQDYGMDWNNPKDINDLMERYW